MTYLISTAVAAARCPYSIGMTPGGLWLIREGETFVAVYASADYARTRYTKLRDAWLEQQRAA